jgi:TPR repeat protein
MDKPWYRKFFGDSERFIRESIQAKADRGDADAQFRLAFAYSSTGLHQAPDYQRAAEWYTKAADQDHSLAQFNLGMMHMQGQGVPRDVAKGIGWFQKAAQQGDPGAQFHLGMNHHRAIAEASPPHASESRTEAYKWYRLAADQGYHGAGAACELMTLSMTHQELEDGNRRADAFMADQVRAPRTG